MAHTSPSIIKLFEGAQNAATTSGGSSTPRKIYTLSPNMKADLLSPVKADLIKYFQKHGLEKRAKDIGVLPANGDTSAQSPKIIIQQKLINASPRNEMVFPNANSAIAMPTFKVGSPNWPKSSVLANSILAPKLVKIASSPVAAKPVAFQIATSPAVPKTIQTAISPLMNKTLPLNNATLAQKPGVQLAQKTVPPATPKNVLANSPVILSTPRINRTPQPLLPTPQHWPAKRVIDYVDGFPESKRSRREKSGKGLRHFSMKVCEKVRMKGTTSYNEVADELVHEFSNPHRHACATDVAYDQKNIRRRVYDALNVLMAMNIISKEKKEIKWLGLPTNSAQEYQSLEKEKELKIEKIKLKMQNLQDLLIEQIALKNITTRNKEMAMQLKGAPPNARIKLPFILLSTKKDTVIDCSISGDKKEYKFTFNDVFQINNETDILVKMGLDCGLRSATSTPEQMAKAKSLVPRALQHYITMMSQGRMEFPPGMYTDEQGVVKFDNEFYSDPSNFVYCELQESDTMSHNGSDYIDMENTQGSSKSGMSRQSSVGSRPGTSTPSEGYTDSDEGDSDLDSEGD